jgi:Periplasmic component of the Tol biopolymer transport system
LKRAEVAGGPAVNLCDVSDPRPGSWSRNGVIIFAPSWRDPLYRVSASGGTPTPVTQFDKSRLETTHRHPWFLPDGDHFLFLAATHLADSKSDLNGIYVGSLSSKERKLILRTRSNVSYAAGFLLFTRETSLMAQHFDLQKLELVGDPVRIADNVRSDPEWFRSTFGASETGTVVYASGGSTGMARLTAFDRQGKKLAAFGESSELIQSFCLSPDASKAAVSTGDTSDLWLFDLRRVGRTRLTSAPLSEYAPVWSPDGRSIVFASDRGIPPDLFIKPSDGTAPETLLLHSDEVKQASDWSRDGRYVAFEEMKIREREKADIWILPMLGERKPFPFLTGPADERAGTFSPDGKWMAYLSDESGRYELYVTSFPQAGTRQQLSTSGAKSAGRWTADGKEILYLGYDDALMSIKIRPATTFEFDAPLVLCKLPRAKILGFATDPAGQKIYLVVPDQAAPEAVTFITSALPSGR